MPETATLTLTVMPGKNGKCIAESQANIKKGNIPCTVGNRTYTGGQRELKVEVDDKTTGGNTVVRVDLAHGRPHYYFENPPLFPFAVSENRPVVLVLKEEMGLATRPSGHTCFQDECSPYAQLIQFTHLDDSTGQPFEDCPAPKYHTSVHVEC